MTLENSIKRAKEIAAKSCDSDAQVSQINDVTTQQVKAVNSAAIQMNRNNQAKNHRDNQPKDKGKLSSNDYRLKRLESKLQSIKSERDQLLNAQKDSRNNFFGYEEEHGFYKKSVRELTANSTDPGQKIDLIQPILRSKVAQNLQVLIVPLANCIKNIVLNRDVANRQPIYAGKDENGNKIRLVNDKNEPLYYPSQIDKLNFIFEKMIKSEEIMHHIEALGSLMQNDWIKDALNEQFPTGKTPMETPVPKGRSKGPGGMG